MFIEKQATIILNVLKLLDQDEVNNDIRIYDLKLKASCNHATTSTPYKMEYSSFFFFFKKTLKNDNTNSNWCSHKEKLFIRDPCIVSFNQHMETEDTVESWSMKFINFNKSNILKLNQIIMNH